MAATATVFSMLRIVILPSTTGKKAGRRLPLLVQKHPRDKCVPARFVDQLSDVPGESRMASSICCRTGRAALSAAARAEATWSRSAARVAVAVVEHIAGWAGWRRCNRTDGAGSRAGRGAD